MVGKSFHYGSLAYGNGRFVAGGHNEVIISENGASWSSEKLTTVTDSTFEEEEPWFDSANTWHLSFANGLFFAPYGDYYFTSANGEEYTEHWHDNTSGRWGSDRFGKGTGNIFLSTGLYGQLLISSNRCESWEIVIPDSPYYIHDYFQDGSAQIFSGELLSYHHDFIALREEW